MRFALRNQKKIELEFGTTLLNRMLDSLKHAQNLEVLPPFTRIEGDKFDTFKVRELTNNTWFACFYLIGKNKYDVYTVAFKEFMDEK